MNYLKKLIPIVIVSIIAALLAVVLYGYFSDWFLWIYLSTPAIAGILYVVFQKENRSYRFLDRLIIGSILFGALTLAWQLLAIYLDYRSGQFYGNPAYHLWDHVELWSFMQGALALSFISFMAGLAGIVGKGFYTLYLRKPVS